MEWIVYIHRWDAKESKSNSIEIKKSMYNLRTFEKPVFDGVNKYKYKIWFSEFCKKNACNEAILFSKVRQNCIQ